MEAYCNSCGQAYHLNQRNDIPGGDCGQVWINEEHLSLEFACDSCLRPPDVLNEILDAGEAAALARLPEETLLAAAAAGELRHRRTTGGVYLFERGDVISFIEGRR